MSIWANGFDRYDASPKCEPGNKVCGKRCIPQRYQCGEQKRDLTAQGKRVRAIGSAALIGALGFGTISMLAASRSRKNFNTQYNQAVEDFARSEAQRRKADYDFKRQWSNNQYTESAKDPALDEIRRKKFESTMGVRPGATKKEIKTAWRKWAKTNHPDMGGQEAKFKEMSAIFTDYYRDSKPMSIWAEGFESRGDRQDAPLNPNEKKRPGLRRKLATIGGIAVGAGLVAGAYKARKRKVGAGITPQPKSPKPNLSPNKPRPNAPSGPSNIPSDLNEFKRQLNDRNTAWEL